MTVSQVWSVATPTAAGPVALSNTGVLTDRAGQSSFYSLASSSNGWNSSQANSGSQPRVDAGADTLAVLRLESSPGPYQTPTLYRYGPVIGTPRWKYSFPFSNPQMASGVHVSRDGSVIAAWAFSWQTKPCVNSTTPRQSTDVAIFRGDSPTPSFYVPIYLAGDPKIAALSADGNSLLIVSNLMHVVLNTQTGTLRREVSNMASPGLKCAISADGSIYAITRSIRGIDVYVGPAHSSYDSGDADSGCTGLKLSDDGRTMLTGWNMGSPFLEVQARVIDVGPKVVLFQDSIVGTGTLRNEVTSLGASADGSVFAMGMTGDAGTAPGLVVYENRQRTFAQDVAGSIQDVDVSPDGQYVAASRRSLHTYQGGNATGSIELYKRGAVVPPPGPTSYRADVAAADAVSGFTFPLVAQPIGSGPNKSARVQ